MGRRKSKRKPPPKKKMTGNLDTQFTCPFCNHEKSCDVKIRGLTEPSDFINNILILKMNEGLTGVEGMKGKKSKYWDNIVYCVSRRIPDANNLSLRARGRVQ